MSRYIEIPSDVRVLNFLNDQPMFIQEPNKPEKPYFLSFKEFFLSTVIADPKWGVSTTSLFMAIDIRKKVLKLNPDDKLLELSDPEWEKAVEITRDPSRPYDPKICFCAGPHIRSILDAKAELPKEVA